MEKNEIEEGSKCKLVLRWRGSTPDGLPAAVSLMAMGLCCKSKASAFLRKKRVH